jgi:hypothetical protein
MTSTSNHTRSESITSEPIENQHGTPKFDLFASGVATGVLVTVIVETGKGAVSILARNPLFVFGAGFMSGYFTHKYRKEIILSANKVKKHSKDFVSRQKSSFVDMLEEIEDN